MYICVCLSIKANNNNSNDATILLAIHYHKLPGQYIYISYPLFYIIIIIHNVPRDYGPGGGDRH